MHFKICSILLSTRGEATEFSLEQLIQSQNSKLNSDFPVIAVKTTKSITSEGIPNVSKKSFGKARSIWVPTKKSRFFIQLESAQHFNKSFTLIYARYR